MSNPPQTLSVKRKRTEAPVDALILEHSVKRQRSQILDPTPRASPGRSFYFRRLTKPNDASQQILTTPPTPTGERRYHLDGSAGAGAQRVFVEARTCAPVTLADSKLNGRLGAITPEPSSRSSSPQRKRPGARSALRHNSAKSIQSTTSASAPSKDAILKLEALSTQISKEDNMPQPVTSPTKHKPKAPTQRFAERHPDKVAALGDAMDIDSDEYVYDTYIREPIVPDAEGKLPEPSGTVGLLVIKAEDQDWWGGDDESDKEFDTDEEDENAEAHYANDYPEDELSDDDEHDRNVYQPKYRHGSDDEEYDLEQEDRAIGSDEDADDLHFKLTALRTQKVGYWGAYGE